MNTKLLIIVVVVVLAGVVYFGFINRPAKFEGASGLATTLRTATSTTIGPQQNKQIFARLPSCAARVISTKESNIMITLDDAKPTNISSTTLTSVVGFWQAASTTVAYDAELYGCGRWFGYSIASSTITTAEF